MFVTLLILLSITFAANWNSISSEDPTPAVVSLENISNSTTTIKLSLEGYYTKDINLDGNTLTIEYLSSTWEDSNCNGLVTHIYILELQEFDEVQLNSIIVKDLLSESLRIYLGDP